MIETLQTHKFTGWDCYDTLLYDKSGEKLLEQKYYGLMVTGRCGEVDRSRETIYMHPPVVPTGPEFPVRKGLYFKDDYWDGSDIFASPDARRILVTQSVRDALEAIKPTGFKFIRLTEFETDSFL